MRYFYDTEFLEDGRTIELISIGIVAEDGREYYAVNSDMDRDRIGESGWLMENVVPHLPLRGEPYRISGTPQWTFRLDMQDVRVKPKWVIANEVREFLTPSVGEASELWAYYGAYDHVVLAQLWGRMIDLPPDVPMWTNDVQQLRHRLGYPELPAQESGEHNALADAHHVKVMFDALAKIEGV